MSSTKRLVFGSLGVRTPKTKEDEEATRNKLAGPRKEPAVKPTLEATTEQEAEEGVVDGGATDACSVHVGPATLPRR